MAKEWLSDDEQGDFKSKLYSYLQDKASRRSKVTSEPAYEEMQRQMQGQQELSDAGSLVATLSDSASMMGQHNGRRSDVGGIQKFTDNLVGSRQNKFNNFAKMRGMEEQANMNDLSVARYASGLEQYDDQNKRANATQESNLSTAELQRKQLRKNLLGKKTLEGRLTSASGNPVQVDELGNPSELPGYKYRAVDPKTGAPKTSWRPLPGVESTDNQVMGVDQNGNLVPRDLPSNFKTKTAQGEKDAANYYNRASQAGKILDEMEAKGYRPTLGTALNKTLIPQDLRGYVLSDEDQSYSNAAEALAEAKLRKESGAAVPDSEIKRQALVFMAQAGDSDATIAQKRMLRQEALNGLQYAAGGSAKKAGDLSETNRAATIEAKRARLRELRAKQSGGE